MMKLSSLASFLKRPASPGRADVLPEDSVSALYPQQRDSGHEHRRLLYLNRLLVFVVGTLTASNLALAVALAQLVPLQRYQPFFLTLSPKDEQVIQIEPFRIRRQAMEIATLSWIKQWVIKRHSVIADNDAMDANLRWVAQRASEPVVTAIREGGERDYIQKALKDGTSRSVRILADPVAVEQAPGVFLVDFSTQEVRAGEVLRQGRWRATLRVAFREQLINRGSLTDGDLRDLTNPFGFTVVEYGAEAVL